MASLEALIAAHPGTTFIVAHVGCFPENLAWVDRMLTTYPNMVIDVSQRMAELGRQPRAAARLIVKHAERVLFGTDSFPPPAALYRRWYRFLESDDEYFPYSPNDGAPPQGRWAISALQAAARRAHGALSHERPARPAPGLTAVNPRLSLRHARPGSDPGSRHSSTHG